MQTKKGLGVVDKNGGRGWGNREWGWGNRGWRESGLVGTFDLIVSIRLLPQPTWFGTFYIVVVN